MILFFLYEPMTCDHQSIAAFRHRRFFFFIVLTRIFSRGTGQWPETFQARSGSILLWRLRRDAYSTGEFSVLYTVHASECPPMADFHWSDKQKQPTPTSRKRVQQARSLADLQSLVPTSRAPIRCRLTNGTFACMSRVEGTKKHFSNGLQLVF